MAESKQKYSLKITNIPLNIDQTDDLINTVSSLYAIDQTDICSITVLQRSTDARKGIVKFNYSVKIDIFLQPSRAAELLTHREIEQYVPVPERFIKKINRLKNRPVIIGCGPAGLFAALTLIKRGVRPIIFERGDRIATRSAAVDKFMTRGQLNTESNMFFGEGGAGTFSDGKLTTRIKTPLKSVVLDELVKAGADQEILTLTRPHLGSDRLKIIIPNMVNKLLSSGADICFNTAVQDIIIKNNRVKAVQTHSDRIVTDHVFLAAGHSAHDTIKCLYQTGVRMTPKGFAVGFRIEHPRELIDRRQYGPFKDHEKLGAAEYYLTYKDHLSGKGVYSFCMCPGGYVVGCSSSNHQLCTNGMSLYSRNNPFSNAAIVVTVSPQDIPSDHPLKGLTFITELEEKAFRLGGQNYHAPVQAVSGFMTTPGYTEMPRPGSYRPGVTPTDLNQCLGPEITEPLKRGLADFNRKIPGFIEEGVLYGVETRTSSPIRMIRNKNDFHCLGLYGLIPIGEVSGYAGGIMSCAVDGIKAAESFIIE